MSRPGQSYTPFSPLAYFRRLQYEFSNKALFQESLLRLDDTFERIGSGDNGFDFVVFDITHKILKYDIFLKGASEKRQIFKVKSRLTSSFIIFLYLTCA